LDEWGRDEQELVRRCKEGSEAAYAVLVRLHRPRLYTLAYRLLLDRESAEDVVQETFIAAFRQMERFEPRPSLAAWLNTITLRTATRAAARQRARPTTSIDTPAFRDDGRGAAATDWPADGLGVAALADTSPAADPHAAAEAADLRRAVSAAIVELPFKYRAAVVLRHVMGLDYAEAARALDVPLNTFKSHLLRGTKLLREGLAAEIEAPGATTTELEAPSSGTTGIEAPGATTTEIEAPGATTTGSNGRHHGETGEIGDMGRIRGIGELGETGETGELGEIRPAPERIAGGR
jgi:RNA polymerase sigma-70 factor (ECF subfamily)